MKINAAKIGIFAAGAAVGAVISAIITRNVVDKTYREVADKEIYDAWEASKAKKKEYLAQIKELQEKVSQQNVTIQTLADQVKAYGGEIATPKEPESTDDTEDDQGSAVYTSYRERSQREYEKRAGHYRSEEGVEFDNPTEEDYLKDYSVDESGPKVISEDEFSTTCMDYSKDDLRYFMYDGKILSEDGLLVDDYAGIIGEDWKLHGKNAGDEVYVRNEYLNADYRVIFTAGSGENNMDMSSIWDD